VIGAGISQQLIRRVGVRAVAVAGLVFATVGMLVLTGLPVNGSYVSDLLVGLLPMSIGMGLVFVPITLLATTGVPAEDAGLASGLFNTAQQVGGSLGLAVLSTLAASKTADVLAGGGSLTRAARLDAQVAGFHVAFWGSAILLATGAVVLVLRLRRRDVEAIDVEATPVPA
jgi:MFS family permease